MSTVEMDTLAATDVDPGELESVASVVDSLPEGSALAGLLASFVTSVRKGEDVVMASTNHDLTPSQAAKLLGMSRPHLYKLLDAGALPHRRVGRDRRLRAQDVFNYGLHREAARAQLAENFAHTDRDGRAITARLAGVDVETAERLGF